MLSLYYVNLSHVCVCMGVCLYVWCVAHECHSMHVEIRGQLVAVGFLLPSGSRGPSMVRLDSEHPYPLSHLNGPDFVLYMESHS